MNIMFLFFIVLSLQVSAFAQSIEINHSNSSASSYFELLQEMFSEGKMPDVESVKDIFWVGRCFTDKKSNEPTNAGYYLRQKPGIGPLSNHLVQYETATVSVPRGSEDYFDEMTFSDFLKTHGSFEFLQTRFSENGIISELSTEDSSRLRRYSDFLIEELYDIEKQEVFMRCYYYLQNSIY